MRRINRKGNFLVFFLAISSIIIFTMLFIALYNKSKAMTESIGAEQFRLFDVYAKGERALMFIDLSGIYAGYDTVMNLASRGGLLKYDCSSDSDFPYWYKSDGLPKKECYPNDTSAIHAFSRLYPDFLDPYLALYTDDQLPTSKDYYSFSISSSNGKTAVVARTDENIVIAEGGSGAAAQIDLSSGLAYPIEKNGGSDGQHYMVTSCFGKRILKGEYNNHPGIDLGHPRGTSVFAVADGTVIATYDSCKEECIYYDASGTWDDNCYCGKGYGNSVLIQHNGFQTIYGHLQNVLVSKGQTLLKGQQIGTEGSTGLSTGPHLHFEIRINGQRVNPLCFYDTKSPDFIFDNGDTSCTRKDDGCSSLSLNTGNSQPSALQNEKTSALLYSVNPSFKAVINYDFSSYETASGKAKEIVKKCSNRRYPSERDNCVNDEAKRLSDTSMKLNSSCNSPSSPLSQDEQAQQVLQMILKMEQQCSADNDCYCNFNQNDLPNLNGINGEFIFYVKASDKSITSNLCQSAECVKLTNLVWLSDNFNDTYYSMFGPGYEFPKIMFADYLYKVTYQNGEFKQATIGFINESGDYVEWDVSDLIIYKKGPYSIIVNRNAFDSPDNHFSSIEQCSVYPPETYYFCATDLTHSILAYSPASKKVEGQHPQIRFALEIN
jgi:hypothetical protein